MIRLVIKRIRSWWSIRSLKCLLVSVWGFVWERDGALLLVRSECEASTASSEQMSGGGVPVPPAPPPPGNKSAQPSRPAMEPGTQKQPKGGVVLLAILGTLDVYCTERATRMVYTHNVPESDCTLSGGDVCICVNGYIHLTCIYKFVSCLCIFVTICVDECFVGKKD